jgi:peptidoglycan/LPS O-acetylase OafA/YrhL
MATNPGRGVPAGLALLGLLSVFDIVTAFIPPGEGEAGPPLEILVFGVVLGLGSLVLVAMVWRGRLGWPAWLLVALRAISGLLALPAFFVPDVPRVWMVLAAIFLVLTVVGIVLVRPTLRPESRSTRTA